jgi:hypothetical protein
MDWISKREINSVLIVTPCTTTDGVKIKENSVW